MADGHLFNSISLGGRRGNNPGQLKVYSAGILWKKQEGGKAVEVDKSDLVGLTWMKVSRSNQPGVRTRDGLYFKFTGFRDQSNQPHTFVVVSLDPPIRKGKLCILIL